MSDDSFECEVMDWGLFYSLAEEVACKVIDSGYRPDFIVGLARGGWVLSRVLCDFLAVKDLEGGALGGDGYPGWESSAEVPLRS